MIKNYINTLEISQNGILKQYYQQPLQNENWIIKPHNNPSSKYICLYNKNDTTNSVYCDTIIYLQEYLNQIYSREFQSILIGGLGLGLVPYICQNFCDKIDVVEIDSTLINLISSGNYLNSNVVIHNDDIFNFSTTEKYDVILIDIWDAGPHITKHNQRPQNFNNELQTLTQNLNANLNFGGLMYFPIIDYYNAMYS